MPKKTFDTPLRKPEFILELTSDEDLKTEAKLRKEAAKYLRGKKTHPLVNSSGPLGRAFSTDLATDTGTLPPNFSLSTLGDYVCQILNTSIVGAAHGRIDDILLTVPPNLTSQGSINTSLPVDPMDERHLKTLMGLLDEHTHITLLCHVHQIPTVEQWLNDLGISMDRASVSLSVFKYSIWAQDAYVALRDQQGQVILCEGVNFPRYDDMSIADDIAAQTDVRALQSYLYFQGGNVLGAKDSVLIGADYVMKNYGRAHLETTEKVIDGYESLFGREVISLGRATPIPAAHRQYMGGGLYQPIFHIDMYITPTGVISDSGKEIVLVGRPSKARSILGQSPGPVDYDSYFEEAQDQLDADYEVVEMPLLPTFASNRYYYLSYNNAVLENYTSGDGEQKRVVYMPTFAQDADDYGVDEEVREALDAGAEQIWKDIGFEVRKMDGLEDLAYGWGSVHCITKALVRSGYPANGE